MRKIYITHETIGSDEEMLLCEDLQDLAKFYMGPADSVNDSDATCEILVEFICTKALFPIYLTFEPLSGMEDDLERLFQSENIEYSLRFESPKNKQLPVFKLTIETPSTLTLVFRETFLAAICNHFYALSLSDNIIYKSVVGKSWFGHEKTLTWPHFDMNAASTVIEIWHDGDGFNLYTNEAHFSTIEKLVNHFPAGTSFEKNED